MEDTIAHLSETLILWLCLRIFLSHLKKQIIWTAVSVVNFYFYERQEVTFDHLMPLSHMAHKLEKHRIIDWALTE